MRRHPFRAAAIIIVASITAATISTTQHWAWWGSPLLTILLVLAGCYLSDRFDALLARRAARKATRRHFDLVVESMRAAALENLPIVLDEDGAIHVPILYAGEHIDVDCDPERGYVAARIIRPDGTIRQSADWSTRH